MDQEEIQKNVERAKVKPLDLKEPSVEVRVVSKTHELPKHIRLTRNYSATETKIYKRMDVQQDVEDELDRRNKILNILLIVSIVTLVILITVFVGLGLQLLGVI